MAKIDGEEFGGVYRQHGSTLRNWLVAFGVGAPVLILSNERFWGKLAATAGVAALDGLPMAGYFAQEWDWELEKSLRDLERHNPGAAATGK